MKIRTLIQHQTPITIDEDDELALALQTMMWAEIRHLPVLSHGHLAGVLSERDILARQAALGRKAAAVQKAGTVMSRPAIVVEPDEDIAQAAGLMLDRRIGALPVVEHGKVIGIVTNTDLLFCQAEEHLPDRTHGRAILVKNAMRTDLTTASAEDLLLDAVARMEDKGVRHLPVVDGDKHLVGMLSDRDVRTAIGNAARPLGIGEARVRLQSTRVGHVMSRRPFAVQPEAALSEAAHYLINNRVSALAVVDPAQHLVGILSYIDILRVEFPTAPLRVA